MHWASALAAVPGKDEQREFTNVAAKKRQQINTARVGPLKVIENENHGRPDSADRLNE